MRKILINTIKLTVTAILTILAFKYAKIERGYNAFWWRGTYTAIVLGSSFLSAENG